MRQHKINFIGYISGNTGYSVLSRTLIALLEYAGIDIRVDNLYRQPIQELLHLQQKDPAGRFQLLHQIPTVNPFADGYYTVTEFDQPTYGSISIMRRAKWILTESEFCKKVFEEFTDAPIDIIHYPLDPQYKPTGPLYKFTEEVSKYRFKFLSIFEWIMRKDPYTLISAFTKAFPDEDDVCLILRCWSKWENPRKWIGVLGKRKNIIFLPDEVPHLAPLYRACDCFVTSTLGEGFGHPIAEAMACGIPVIVPNSTGIKDFCNKNNATLIPVTEMEVKDTKTFKIAGNELDSPRGHPFGLIKPWFKTWEPDEEALIKAMQRVYKKKPAFQINNALKIREKLSYDNILQEIKEAFEIPWEIK